jgi:hypothetical protein
LKSSRFTFYGITAINSAGGATTLLSPMLSSCRVPTPQPVSAPALPVTGKVVECAASPGQSARKEFQRRGCVSHLQTEVVLLQQVVETPEFGHQCARPRHDAVDDVHYDLVVGEEPDHFPSLQNAHVNELLECQRDRRQLQQDNMGHLLSSIFPEAAHLVKALAPCLQRTCRPNVAPKVLREESVWIVVLGLGWDGLIGKWVEMLRKVSPELEVRHRRMRKSHVPAPVEVLGSQLGNERQAP